MQSHCADVLWQWWGSSISGVFEMELGTYVIGILFPLDMNQDEDEPLYLQSRT